MAVDGNVSVSPTVTTIYTLTATGPGGTASATVTVTVNVAAPAPTVVSFTATPATITSGGSSLLEWVTTDTDSVTIDPGIGTFAGNTGSSLESPTLTTIYTLIATGPGGTASASVTVTVNVGPAPSISISLATWEASTGNAAIAGSVFPAGSSVTVYVPGTTTNGIACTGGGNIIATLATDGAGNFAAETGPGGLLSNPGEYCVD